MTANNTSGASQMQDPNIISAAEVGQHDIMLGRGTGPNENPGNRFFRDIVTSNCAEHAKATARKEKEVVIQRIIHAIERRGGRYIRELTKPASVPNSNLDNKQYLVVKDEKAIRTKVLLAVRYAKTAKITSKDGEASCNAQGPNKNFQESGSAARRIGRDGSHFKKAVRSTNNKKKSAIKKNSSGRRPMLDLTNAAPPQQRNPHVASKAAARPTKVMLPRSNFPLPSSASTCFTPVSKNRPQPRLDADSVSATTPMTIPAPTSARLSSLDVLAAASAAMASQERLHAQSPSDVTRIDRIQQAEARDGYMRKSDRQQRTEMGGSLTQDRFYRWESPTISKFQQAPMYHHSFVPAKHSTFETRFPQAATMQRFHGVNWE